MILNGIDLSSLGVKLYDRVINSNQVDTTQQWLDGDIQPTYIRQQDRYKSVKLSFLVLGRDEDDAFKRISRLTALLKKATVKFDDINLLFNLTLNGEAKTERLKNGNFIVSYNLTSDYAKGDREIYTTDARATSSFKLTVLYYQNSTVFLGTESITIRANSFTGLNDTLASIGVEVDKYRANYYNTGVPTNLGGKELTYDNLQELQTLIINYAPTTYNLTVDYYMKTGDTGYGQILTKVQQFTYPQLQNAKSIGQIVDAKTYKPAGYRARIDYTGELTVEALLLASPISVLYDQIENEQSKNIVIYYEQEKDDGSYERTNSLLKNITETQVLDGMTLADFITVDTYRPNPLYYNNGYIQDHSPTELVQYETMATEYIVRYSRATNTIYVEYYAGIYPDWYRLTSIPVATKYKDTYATSFAIADLGIDFNKYHTATYEEGKLYNGDTYTTYDSVITAGVLQIYYTPINYPLVVRYYTQGSDADPVEETININELMFFGNPTLNDIVDITKHRPEGFQFDADNSYKGEITLSALTQNMPINIVYKEIEAVHTKNIIIRYRQELASAFSTINTSLITVNEADTVGGVRLRDIINLNAYRPDYYDEGIIDGTSSSALLNYESLASDYNVLYMASTYTTPVRYYTDDIDDRNWIGSNTISYRVIDFTADTTLYDLGFNLNAYKPVYCDDGILQYTGPVNFTALRELESINVLYETAVEPEDPSGIDYPHRFLFLQHNDLGAFEDQHPNWTMNHAYINTGVSAEDMSKLTVVMECDRVDDNVPLHEVNEGYAYLFGSASPAGSFYMRFNNQTMYGTNLTGVNTYEAKAGLYSNPLTLTEANAIGFSENSGIYASARDGYSVATFTYSNQIQTEHAQMPYPIYLFANNNAGAYADGLGGIGIYGCRIYYNDELIRDYVPVQFYDKIGDQVAPSNCLYDKVSKAFFEDATGMNSFNIIDDDRYTDTNLEHKIGHCYVNYYKNGVLFQNTTIYFRGNDFDTEWDLYEKLFVDKFQPPYYKSGEILNLAQFPVINFDTINNAVFQVNYEEIENQIQVYYYKNSVSDDNLIAHDVITLTEKDFYQVPTFGDLVRLNKYRPDGFKTDFQYTGSKVSLSRVVENQPYRIVYVPETGTQNTYTTTVKYQRKIWGPHNYEVLGQKTLTFTDSQFRDGEYIDFFIDFNAFKPAKYYGDGEPYEWYLLDKRLTTPADLLSEYTVAYQPTAQSVAVNYYTDVVDEANLIASTDWMVQIDEFDGSFYLVDMLPNEYINKFKPVNCDGGVLQNTDVLYTFDTLLTKGTIEIVYETMAEPGDPENASYIQKVLYFDGSEISKQDQLGNKYNAMAFVNGGCIPWIDLGYRPQEIGRLKVETKMAIREDGFRATTTGASFQDDSYTYAFGYVGAPTVDKSGATDARLASIHATPGSPHYYEYVPSFSPCSTGGFGIKPRLPVAETGVYTDAWFTSLDGEKWSGGSGSGFKPYNTTRPYSGITAVYRKGQYEDTDINYEPFVAYKDYSFSKTFNNKTIRDQAVYNDNGTANTGLWNQEVVNPFTITLDAYNKRAEIYNYADSNVPISTTFEETDTDTFDNRCKPKGSLTLFRTRNPDTGKMNIMAFTPYTYPNITGWGTPGFGTQGLAGMMNPYSDKYTGSVVIETLKITGTDEKGNPIYESVNDYKNVEYSDAKIPIYPQIHSAYIWYMKIWDRDRLVRHLIPVAKGDKIYDYVMPDNGLFDLITEIFFGNSNQGGNYSMTTYGVVEESKQLVSYNKTVEIKPEDVAPFHCIPDPTYWGKITENYYDQNNKFINNQYVDVPTWFAKDNDTIENVLQFNDYKPNDFYLDGMLDTDNPDNPWENYTLKDVYDASVVNIYYKLRTFAKTITYYQDNVRVGTKDIFFSLEDIDKATTLADLGINVDLYWTEDFKHGRVVFNEKILADDDVSAFIDAPSPIVVYDKLNAQEAPNLLYLEYYRGGAHDDTLITLDTDNVNYLNCNLEGVVLNPNGAIKYYNHYHDALYEDEQFNYFMPYQVRVLNKYTPIHYGPGRKYKTLAQIVERDTYTIIDERNGWGRLKEYYHGWILLNQTEPMTGPGQNPDYDVPGETTATIPFAEHIQITRLTIDRLWCYVPAVKSWVKAEDVSFDQAGSLYHGLAMKVIHLDEVDWSNVSTLADIGIYPEAYKLQYHDYCGYTYTGEYTQEAFSAIHSLDFVYPETVYTSSCIYYKHAKTEDNELGRVSISFTLSDWNPDWDIFLETSWKVDENGDPILPTLYRGVPLTLNWDFYGFDKNLYRPDGYPEGFYLWNPRAYYDDTVQFTFEDIIVVGTQYVIYPEFHWEQFKAKVVSGGELAAKETTGVQIKVGTKIYDGDGNREDVANLTMVMATTGQEYLPVGAWSQTGIADDDVSISYASQRAIKYPYNKGYSDYGADDDSDKTNVYIPDYLNTDNDSGVYTTLYDNGNRQYIYGFHNKKLSKEDKYYLNKIDAYNGDSNYFRRSLGNYRYKSILADKFELLVPGLDIGPTSKYYYSGSNNTKGITNTGFNLMGTIYAKAWRAKGWSESNIEDTKRVVYLPNTKWYEKPYAQVPMYDINYDSNKRYAYNTDSPKNQMDLANTGCYQWVKIYAKNILKAFYVPIPEGTKYTLADGTSALALQDSLINLLDLTDIVSLTIPMEDTVATWHESSTIVGSGYWEHTYYRGATLSGGVYRLTDDLRQTDKLYNFFKGWDFAQTDIDYIVEATADTYSYKYPSVANYTGRNTIFQSTILPITKLTTDTANGVDKEWYGFGNPTRWTQSSGYTIYADEAFNKTLLKQQKQTICFLSSNSSVAPTRTSAYVNPAKGTQAKNHYTDISQSAGIITIQYVYNDEYGLTDSGRWVKITGTNYATTQENKNYVVATASLPIYTYPNSQGDYWKTATYARGDRLTVLYRSTYNTHWCYTGQGWIYNVDDNLSLIE